jgi:hypothetical protein
MANDPTGYLNMGGMAGPGTLAPEGIDKGQDSLTQFLRSMTNLLGQQGQQTFAQGQKTAGTGEGVLKSSLPALRQSLQGLASPEQYYQNILSGDKAAMEQAVAPETSSILDQYRGKRAQMAKLGPRGGGTAEAVAGSQFGQAGDVARVLQTARPQAAQGAQQVAGQRAQTGGAIAGVGAQLGQLGLGESGQGMQQLAQTLQGLLARRGQDMGPGSISSQFSQYAASLI